MTPLGAFLTLSFALAVVVAPRRHALLGVIGAVCYVTQGQAIDVGGFHFTAIRMVLLAGVARAFARGEVKAIKWSPIDKSLAVFVGISSLLFALRNGTGSSVVYQLGLDYNVVLSYILFRSLFQSYAEVEEFLPRLAVVMVPMAAFMIFEGVTDRNLFASFGGVNEMDITRDGHNRASAAFRSPITAGTFAATFWPLFLALLWIKQHRMAAITGVLAATLITAASRSSGPALECLAALVGLLFWRWRQHMQLLRRGIVVTLIGLHLIMKAPVWFLLSHLGDLVGGGGWHRAAIIDAAVNHFSSWWLWGTDLTGDWMATELTSGGADLTNQFVAEGVHAGLPAMFAFIWIMVRCFQNLGLAMKKAEGNSPGVEKMLWALGVALFATVVNFFSVSYFDQIHVIWYMLLAMIASATSDLSQQPDLPMGEDASVEDREDFAHETIPGDTSLRKRVVQ